MNGAVTQGHSSKTTPNPLRSGLKTTPVCLNRTHGGSAFTSPFAFPSMGPSPMKPIMSSESPSSQLTDSGAARTLMFDRYSTSRPVTGDCEVMGVFRCGFQYRSGVWGGGARDIFLFCLLFWSRDEFSSQIFRSALSRKAGCCSVGQCNL